MQLKEHTTARKLRGGYYTDRVLADYIVNQIELSKDLTILEPSCGDGVFLRSIRKYIPDQYIDSVDAVEVIKEEVDVILSESWNSKYHIECNDFFKFYHSNNEKKYKLILGNPPYIRYQYLSKEQREIQSEILKKNGMTPNKLINSWVCFLVACVERLEENGQIGFVIPAELLQIVYAQQLRQYLTNELSKIILVTFKELVFEGIEQEVVVLIATKRTMNKVDSEQEDKLIHNQKKRINKNGSTNKKEPNKDQEVSNKTQKESFQNQNESKIAVVEFQNLKDLKPLKDIPLNFQQLEPTKDKWTKYFLSTKENMMIKNIMNRKDFCTFDDISIVNVGITTGNNKYFSVDKKTVEKYKLQEVVLPLIGRSSHAHGIYFTKEDWMKNVSENTKAYLINFPENISFNEYPKLHKKYIHEGEKNNDHIGYKCGIRDRWYIVPSVWVPDAFFLRRNNTFPKFVRNNINAVSTDTMHRIKFKDGVNGEKALLSYYNSITFAFTEIAGRSYGGGVLEILPREVGGIRLPDLQDFDEDKTKELLKIIDHYVRNKLDIEELLDIVDQAVLVEYKGISLKEVNCYRAIWKKLMSRRLERS